ncbi:MAG: thioredoxin family protein [Acidimicrobiia bacterium]|nr:thioredoxin family protein [Acidimicrobiia bacterium]
MIFRRKRIKATRVESVDTLQELAGSGQPVLVDFMQVNCAPCKVMDGIVDELAEEFQDSAHVVKVNVTQLPAAAHAYGVKSTPTFIVLASSPKAKKKAAANGTSAGVTARWRATGLVKKDALRRVLQSNGAG